MPSPPNFLVIFLFADLTISLLLLHCPYEQIAAETDRLTGSNKGISDKAIRLKVFSPHVSFQQLKSLGKIEFLPSSLYQHPFHPFVLFIFPGRQPYACGSSRNYEGTPCPS